jgi:hypothetical protein
MKVIALCAPVALGVAALLGGSTRNATATAPAAVTSGPQDYRRVEIDILPTRKDKEIKLSEKNKAIDVAILGQTNLPISQFEKGTVEFAEALPTTMAYTSKDINADGKSDANYKFAIGKMKLAVGDTVACVIGTLLDGQKFKGCGKITVVP